MLPHGPVGRERACLALELGLNFVAVKGTACRWLAAVVSRVMACRISGDAIDFTWHNAAHFVAVHSPAVPILLKYF